MPADPGLRISIWQLLLIALAVGGAVAALLPSAVHAYVRVLVAWDAGVILFVPLLWLELHRRCPEELEQRAARSRGVTAKGFFVLVVGLLASLTAIAIMLTRIPDLPRGQRGLVMALSFFAVACTWLLTHLTYALRYAYVYYRHRQREPDDPPLIDFQCDSPGYWDFLYVGFAVGITFGVTDTALFSSPMRALVTAHGVLAFWFNTIILALALNLVSALF